MAAGNSRIRVEDVVVNQQTGHIMVRVRTHTQLGSATWLGPKKSYGCDADTFRLRFNSDIEQLKSWIVSEHAAHTGVHLSLVESLGALKGQDIG